MKKTELFTNKNIVKSILLLGLPLILSQVVNVLYNIVDRIFIGNMDIIGKDALAGVGITFPIIVIVSAFAALFGFGGAPLAAIKMGENKNDEARKIMMNSFSMLLMIGILLMVVLFIFGKPLLFLFGMTDELLTYGIEYLNIYAIGTIFVMISVGMNTYISAQGHTLVSAIIVLIGAILNTALDPLFIFVFNMGVKGAALATIISQGVTAILVVLFLISRKSNLRLSFKNFKPNKKIIFSIMALGISPFVMQSTEALIQIVFNNQIVKYGGEDYIVYLNIMTIMLSVLQFMTLPVQGLTQGASPLISFNYGCNNMKRVKSAYKTLMIMSVSFTLLFYLIIFFLPKPIASIFNSDPLILEKVTPIMRIFFLGMSVFGLQLACQSSFMALGQSLISLSMAVLRKIIILIPLAFILPIYMGVNGIFYAEMIADFIATITTFTLFMVLVNKILNKKLKKDEVIISSEETT
jgi:putative MATE family efflux protein